MKHSADVENMPSKILNACVHLLLHIFQKKKKSMILLAIYTYTDNGDKWAEQMPRIDMMIYNFFY